MGAKDFHCQQKPLPGLASQDVSGQMPMPAFLPRARIELSIVFSVISPVSQTVPGTLQGLNKDLLNKQFYTKQKQKLRPEGGELHYLRVVFAGRI